MIWKRRIAKFGRWLHIYVSMASFAIVFFFAVTGLTLNHSEWFTGQERTNHVAGVLDRVWLSPPDARVDRRAIVEFLQRTHHLSGALADFRLDEQQCAVSFKGPGYSADAFIDRATGQYDLTESKLGLIALLNDLHKGRDTGRAWQLVVDASAALLMLIALSGLLLLYFVHKHRVAGLLALIAGAALVFGLYRALVP